MLSVAPLLTATVYRVAFRDDEEIVTIAPEELAVTPSVQDAIVVNIGCQSGGNIKSWH
jgi:hypothetical protein